MIRRFLKEDIFKTLLILFFSILLLVVIFLTTRDLQNIDYKTLPIYLQIYTFLLMPISNDFTYLFIFTNVHLYLFIFIYLLYLYYRIDKKTPIEKYLPINKKKYLLCRYTAINLQILFIISVNYILYTIFSLTIYNNYYLLITYTYFITILIVLLITLIDYFVRLRRLNKC